MTGHGLSARCTPDSNPTVVWNVERPPILGHHLLATRFFRSAISITRGNSSDPTFVSSYPSAEARCTGKSACTGEASDQGRGGERGRKGSRPTIDGDAGGRGSITWFQKLGLATAAPVELLAALSYTLRAPLPGLLCAVDGVCPGGCRNAARPGVSSLYSSS